MNSSAKIVLRYHRSHSLISRSITFYRKQKQSICAIIIFHQTSDNHPSIFFQFHNLVQIILKLCKSPYHPARLETHACKLICAPYLLSRKVKIHFKKSMWAKVWSIWYDTLRKGKKIDLIMKWLEFLEFLVTISCVGLKTYNRSSLYLAMLTRS